MKSSGEAGALPSAEYKRIYTIGSEPSVKRADALLSEKALNKRRADALPSTSGLARQTYVVRCPGARLAFQEEFGVHSFAGSNTLFTRQLSQLWITENWRESLSLLIMLPSWNSLPR